MECEEAMTSFRFARWYMAVLIAAGLLGAAGRTVAAPPPSPPEKMDDAPSPKRVAAELPPPPSSILDPQTAPIDLPSALKLAGVQNAEILQARERVVEAMAEHQLA